MATCGMLHLASTPLSTSHFRATIRRSGPVAAFQKAQMSLLSASLGQREALPLRILLPFFTCLQTEAYLHAQTKFTG